MNNPPLPKISRAPRVPLIWAVPIVALLVGAWMIYHELIDHGPEISIEFADGSGVEAGKTALVYKGVAVGVVKSAVLKNDLGGVTVEVRLDKSASSLAAQGSRFWIVYPEIGFSGVHGLDTLLTGVRLGVQPGNGPLTTHFRGLDKAPAAFNPNAGRAFLLRSSHLGSLTVGAPVNYRELKVGQVEAISLADDSASILVRIRVDALYADLVRSNTQFWNAGGVSIKVGLLGAEIRSTSLEAIATGAIGFATPDTPGAIAKEGSEFGLSPDVDAEWLKWQPKIPIHPQPL